MSCSSVPGRPDNTAPATATSSPSPTHSTRPGTVVWTVDRDRPAGQHVLVGEVLVGYVVKLHRLVLRAIDPVTGLIIWERPASPGSNPPGVSTPVETYGDKIIYLVPDEDDHYRTAITLLDAATGAIHTTTERSYYVDGFPEQCSSRICFHDRHGNHGRSLAMSPHTGSVRQTATYRGRIIGDHGLVELVHDDLPSSLGRFRDGELIWDVPFSEIFGIGFSPDGGWRWDYEPEADLFTGEVGWVPEEKVEEDDMKRHSIMVGLDAETGALHWKQVGTTRFCPPVGAAEFDDPEIDDYRCRFEHGSTAVYGEKHLSFRDVRMSLERFDGATGKTLWSARVKTFTGDFGDYEATGVRIDDDHVMIPGKQGPTKIGLSEGQATPLSTVPALWCLKAIRLPYLGFYDDKDSQRFTGSAQTACDRSGKPTKITTAIPAVIGVHADTRVIVTSERSVTAYRE